MMQRDPWFEDFAVGQRFATAGWTFSEAQILEFGLVHTVENQAEETVMSFRTMHLLRRRPQGAAG